MVRATDELSMLESFFDRLQPLPRSITGDGVRQTHDVLAELLPLERMEIPSRCCSLTGRVLPSARLTTS